MHVLVDAETKKLLGAALLGIEADEAIHCIIDTMAAGLPYTASAGPCISIHGSPS
jgi:pyruvate/2-oxoglutarate dehydrogenase complex dihydrolipoamide dehydrogenase (E3) component